jgi:hypothetical protein
LNFPILLNAQSLSQGQSSVLVVLVIPHLAQTNTAKWCHLHPVHCITWPSHPDREVGRGVERGAKPSQNVALVGPTIFVIRISEQEMDTSRK